MRPSLDHAAVLHLEDVHFSYGSRPLLSGVTLTVRQGELVGLVGPNGAGKTTLLRLISGVLRPQQGRVFVLGHDIHHLPAQQRARLIAVVRQNPALPAAFTALDLVLMGRVPHLGFFQREGRTDYRVATAALEHVDALELADRRLGELSGGEQQRVLIARALAQEAPLLLLDEPTAHLDIGHQGGIFALLQRLTRQGHTVLAVVHDLTLAAQFCQRLVLLGDGRLIADGRPDEVLALGHLQAVYGDRVHVDRSPQTGRPIVLPRLAAAEPDGRGPPSGPPPLADA